MEVPGLDDAIEHQRVTPLAKALGEEIIVCPDNLPEKASLIGMGQSIP